MANTLQPAKLTTANKIKRFLNEGEGSTKLTDQEDETRKRVVEMWSLMCDSYHSPSDAIKKFEKLHDYSRAQAYRYLAICREVFGNVDKHFQKAQLMIANEMNYKLLQLSIKNGDMETHGKCIDRMIAITDKLKVEEPIDLEDFVSEVHIKLSRKDTRVLKDLATQGLIDLNKLGYEEAQIIEG